MAVITIDADVFAPAPGVSGNDPANRVHAVLRAVRWRVGPTLVGGEAGSTIRMATLPQRARYCSQLSKMGWKGFGAGRTLNAGFLAYTTPAGQVVRANAAGLGSGLDVAADGRSFFDAFPLSSVDEIEFPAAAVLTLTVVGGTIPVGTTLGGLIVYLAAFC